MRGAAAEPPLRHAWNSGAPAASAMRTPSGTCSTVYWASRTRSITTRTTSAACWLVRTADTPPRWIPS
jgi:hypothetical protein